MENWRYLHFRVEEVKGLLDHVLSFLLTDAGDPQTVSATVLLLGLQSRFKRFYLGLERRELLFFTDELRFQHSYLLAHLCPNNLLNFVLEGGEDRWEDQGDRRLDLGITQGEEERFLVLSLIHI